ncbi:hypothetical protein [Roseimaritima ulvae]|uniref:Chromosome partition protein Smc n=1 Tax=Roseimaritima ulvae TaxID=980254 RepID=A0A5B9QQN0_9BACT|nr:hypothetical protein [Roseimaritima ulvae]QEG41407.1 hypothetical protein UC8_34280 [Roseimaritima ulvae]
MTNIERCVRNIRRRQQRQWLWKAASHGLLCAAVLACLLALVCMIAGRSAAWTWMAGLLLAGPILGAAVALLRGPSMRDAAVAIDRCCNLKDRTQTAMGFLRKREQQPLRRLQIADAEQHLADIDPVAVAPIRNPRSFPIAVAIAIAAVGLVFLTSPKTEVVAAPVVSSAVSNSASRAADGLEELRVFQQQEQDPELEQLLKELADQIDELKQPGMDPKEALAQLSEMEAALQEMQKQLHDPGLDAQLQQVGDALSLSAAMATAGAAMSEGQLDKAEEELTKLELPELDRKTEKAITEKLSQVKENDKDGGQKRKALKDAVSQVSEGLSSGNRSQFKDGMKGLASECKKQGNRKKLSDLLRKQCQCLSECKSECEGECKSQADSKKKGGNKAGTGRSGNDPGEQTPQLKTNPQMNITGQDSGQGDVDVETSTAPEQQQQAVRNYRENAEQYEAMSESVLSSESIPLGHRQTIRRYFEMIRPQGSETDQVVEQTTAE